MGFGKPIFKEVNGKLVRDSIVKNNYIIYDNYAEIEIIGGSHGDRTVRIDLEDVEKCKQFKWHVGFYWKKKKEYGKYYIISSKSKLLHRYLLDAPKGLVVDHKDGDTMNNRKENIRICTNSNNAQNGKERTNNKSGYKGVCWNGTPYVNKWKAYIMVDYKTINLGHFDKLEDAVKVRREAEIKYFGVYRNNCGDEL